MLGTGQRKAHTGTTAIPTTIAILSVLASESCEEI